MCNTKLSVHSTSVTPSIETSRRCHKNTLLHLQAYSPQQIFRNFRLFLILFLMTLHRPGMDDSFDWQLDSSGQELCEGVFSVTTLWQRILYQTSGLWNPGFSLLFKCCSPTILLCCLFLTSPCFLRILFWFNYYLIKLLSWAFNCFV